MDGYLIYEFTDEAQASSALVAINHMAAEYWVDQGYTVIHGENGPELVGKKNGVDALDSAKTITWDEVKQSQDDTFYFASLSNDPRFANGTQQLIDAGFVFTEKEFPLEWNSEIV